MAQADRGRIGLDAHDAGVRSKPLSPGMAFTIEPGIYIREAAHALAISGD